MEQRVDAHGLRIIAGGRAWPFEVDCRIDCARIELNGISYQVRPLSWRDKHVLSRFAAAGEAFLRREFVRLSLVEPATLPAGEDDLALLFELARWHNSPDGREMLPFDSVTLSLVTMKLCQNMRLAPEHFDQRNASEIESLWRAAGASRAIHEEIADPPPTEPSSDTTERQSANKILILPDPDVPGARSTTAVNFQSLESSSDPSSLNQMAFGQQSVQNPRIAPEASAAPRVWVEAPDSEAMHSTARALSQQVSDPSAIETATEEFDGPAPPATPTTARREANHRQTLVSESSRSPSLTQTPFVSDELTTKPFTFRSFDSESAESRSEANRLGTESFPLNSSILVRPALSDVREAGLGPEVWTPFASSSPRLHTRALSDFRVHDSRTLLTTLPHSAPDVLDTFPGVAAPTGFADPESVLDELADRLAEAAMQLGIDVEY